jgi:hypothetical protein
MRQLLVIRGKFTSKIVTCFVNGNNWLVLLILYEKDVEPIEIYSLKIVVFGLGICI